MPGEAAPEGQAAPVWEQRRVPKIRERTARTWVRAKSRWLDTHRQDRRVFPCRRSSFGRGEKETAGYCWKPPVCHLQNFSLETASIQ